jgi:agmatine/peptidylarginine deiminase
MVITPDVEAELKLRFEALMAYEKKNEGYKDEIKENNKSMKETIKALADKLEVKAKNVKDAFKDYKKALENKEDVEEKDSIIVIIKEHNLIK